MACFAPGLLALSGVALGDRAQLALAEELAASCVAMGARTPTGLAPEIADFSPGPGLAGPGPPAEAREAAGVGEGAQGLGQDVRPKMGAAHNLLRPEVAESLFVLHRLTHRPQYRRWGWDLFQAFEAHARLPSGGYSGVADVAGTRRTAGGGERGAHGADDGRCSGCVRVSHDGRMESFWLAETLKYLYLLFSEDELLPLHAYAFSTEGHPLRLFTEDPLRTRCTLEGAVGAERIADQCEDGVAGCADEAERCRRANARPG